MGLLSRISTVFKAQISKLLDRAEDPRVTLDYSYQRQLERLRDVKRGLADVVSSKKRLELQVTKLEQQTDKLEQQAKDALKAGREDLATTALQRRQLAIQQLSGLHEQIEQLQVEQDKLTQTEARLQAKVEAFRTQKEVIKAQYSAAEAQVKIGEAATGLSEELADVGLAVERARDKTDNMRARAAAIDELVESGVLEDSLSGDPIEAELQKLSGEQQVAAELERLKKEVGGE